MKKRVIAITVALTLVCTLIPMAYAASEEEVQAAQSLYELGLFNGTGTNPNGTPNFDLDRAPTRQEAITMLVRLLGKEEEAKAGTWETPFTDVDNWAKPYVGYAYTNGLTTGAGKTSFGSSNIITASQYLTFILRALGYESGTDFQWDKAWELSDQISLTTGQYNTETTNFTRGDVAKISYSSLSFVKKESGQTLLESLKTTPTNDTTPITMYAPDGRTNVVPRNMVEANKAVGWYEKPVTILYASDGRAQVTFVEDVEAQLTVGWFRTQEEALNLATDKQKADILTAYNEGLESHTNGVICLLAGLKLAANASDSEVKIARMIASYQAAQDLDAEAVNSWKKAIELCGTHSNTQVMKGHLEELVAQFSPLQNYKITAQNILEYIKRNTEQREAVSRITDNIDAEAALWVQSVDTQ